LHDFQNGDLESANKSITKLKDPKKVFTPVPRRGKLEFGPPQPGQTTAPPAQTGDVERGIVESLEEEIFNYGNP